MWRKREHPNRIIFKPRFPELMRLERALLKKGASFILSTSHRDMLRCSITKHFKSCYAPDGINKHIPFELCHSPSWVIIGEKDRSGDFIWRAFARYYYSANGRRYWSEDQNPFSSLTIYKIYGNPPMGTKMLVEYYLKSFVDDVIWEDCDAC